jgi:hypothetical protein
MSKNPGPVIRYLSEKLMIAIPEFTELEPFRDKNINNWRVTGAYSLHAATKNSFTLSVNSREYAAVIFADTQHLLNHASEHRAQLLDFGDASAEASPSWNFVSLYYFSLFVAMAWTRVSNNAILYLDKDSIHEFCGTSTGVPGGGAYKMQASTDSLSGETFVEFKKTGSTHFHEAVWIALHSEIWLVEKWVTQLSASRKPTSEEELSLRALRLFRGLSADDPLVWPSKLRNAINYRPGFSYRSILKHNFLKIRSRISKPANMGFEAIVINGEIAKSSLQGVRNLIDFPNEAVNLLINQSLIIENFVEDALMNICTIRDLSCSAKRLRSQFNKKMLIRDSLLNPLPT